MKKMELPSLQYYLKKGICRNNFLNFFYDNKKCFLLDLVTLSNCYQYANRRCVMVFAPI